jgi:phosphoserine phosphatase
MRPLEGPISWAGCAEPPAVALAISTPVADAAFFDLDKTIIAGSSALAFSRSFLREGLISRRAVLRSGYAQLLLLLAGADASTMDRLRERITALCAGWDVAQVRGVVTQALHETV